MSKPSKDAVDMAVKMSKVKPTECETVTHSVIEHTRHGVIRTEVRTQKGQSK